jgi:hypothetical protein
MSLIIASGASGCNSLLGAPARRKTVSVATPRSEAVLDFGQRKPRLEPRQGTSDSPSEISGRRHARLWDRAWLYRK